MSDTDVEVDGVQIVRPERFVLPEVSGTAVPLRVRRKGELICDWQLLLRWQDGRREQVSFSDCLPLSAGQVFLRPRPGEPQSELFDKWRRGAREAWLRGDDPMPPDEVCRRLLVAFAKHLELPPDSAAGTVAALTCWTVLTYIHSVFEAIPYLAIGGALGCGKTRVLDLLEQVIFRPFATSSLSNSVLFRHLHTSGGTMLIDEGEQFGSRSPEVAEVFASLLAGYRRGKTVSRSESTGDGNFAPRQYSVSGPKAIACINEMIPALASRAIPIRMIRAPGNSAKIRLRIAESKDEWAAIRDALHAMAMDFGEDWLELPAKQDVCPEMSGRNYELWQPLLAIAEWLDRHGASGLYGDLRKHAIRTIESSAEAAIPAEDEVVLQTLCNLVEDGRRPMAKEILQQATTDEPGLFRNWTARRVSACLGRYGIAGRKSAGKSVYDPSLETLVRVSRTYQIDLGLPDADDEIMPHRVAGVDGVDGVHVQQGV